MPLHDFLFYDYGCVEEQQKSGQPRSRDVYAPYVREALLHFYAICAPKSWG